MTLQTLRSLFLVCLLAVGSMPFGGSAFAQARPAPAARAGDEAPAAGKVKVEVKVVYANQSGQIDPELRDLQRQLNMMKFTGYQVLSTHSPQLGLNQSSTVTIEGGRKMEITLLSRDDQTAKVRIELYKDNQKTLDTTVSVHRGGELAIGGPNYQQGKLVFAIAVTY